ncbi:MAG: HAMP domain-containing histidine kinase, partial [Desulfamplus sp.]|nr:HAMP domain-containing histidine kinase [Desulfamplus sp.]
GFAILEMAYKLSGLARSAHIISTATERAAKIVFALKNYAHFDRTEEMVIANVIEGIETVLTLYHNQLKQGVEVRREYSDIPLIPCFPDELNQVWTNLLHNAIQAMDRKGILTITVSCQDRPSGETAGQSSSETENHRHEEKKDQVNENPVVQQIIVRMSDTGKGIPQDISSKIFDPFYTTKPAGEGSGLGLHIVKTILEKHKGSIGVQSEIGKGSVFTVRIPVSQPADQSITQSV